MQSGRCDSCYKPALPGKAHCLDHHKEQGNYTYGLDHDLQQKMAAKNDPAKAGAVRVWIEAVTKRQLTNDLQASLKSGVVLCELVNTLYPGAVKKINQGAMPFVQRENIVAYLSACKQYANMRESDMFVTQDLFEGSNMAQVVDQICALGNKVSGTWRGAQLVISGGAVQVASSNVRVAAPAAAQVPLTSPTYQQPSTQAGSTVSYKQAPTYNAGQPAASSPSWKQQSPSSAPAPPARPAPVSSPAGASAGPKFCGGCGAKRADAAAKFCGECGAKY